MVKTKHRIERNTSMDDHLQAIAALDEFAVVRELIRKLPPSESVQRALQGSDRALSVLRKRLAVSHELAVENAELAAMVAARRERTTPHGN
jgi:hypothetical protein